jgi:hypothetical protein
MSHEFWLEDDGLAAKPRPRDNRAVTLKPNPDLQVPAAGGYSHSRLAWARSGSTATFRAPAWRRSPQAARVMVMRIMSGIGSRNLWSEFQ